MVRKLLFVVAATAALLAGAPVSATTTYVGSHTVDSGSVNLSISTDDTIGVLTQSNITDWSFTMTNSGGSVTIDSSNSDFTYFSGNALSATASDLIFDFSAIGHMQWDDFGRGSNDAFCLDTPGAAFTCIGNPPSVTMVVDGSLSNANFTGQFVLGTAVAAGVPEPATWAMMLIGFGAIGFHLRRRDRSRVGQVVAAA